VAAAASLENLLRQFRLTPTRLNAHLISSYYNALALDTIIYLAQPKGFNNTITKIQGTTQIPDVYDIELLTDLFYSIIGMPRSWFGGQGGEGGGDSGEAPSGKSLLAQDMRFLRKIKSIRRPIIQQYEWLGYFHAILKGKKTEQLDIKAMMPPIGSLEDQMKMEMLQKQSEVLDMLADVMDKYSLPKEAWVETIFKRYMHLPDDVVNVFITALPGELDNAQQQDESLRVPRKSPPYTYKLIREIDARISGTPGGKKLVEDLRASMDLVQNVEKRKQRQTMETIMGQPKCKENDLIISSFGRHPFELKRPTDAKSEAHFQMRQRPIQESIRFADDPETKKPAPAPVTESAEAPVEDKAYRRWIN
jgi:hypothetical protein